jgi:hypothetical protein
LSDCEQGGDLIYLLLLCLLLSPVPVRSMPPLQIFNLPPLVLVGVQLVTSVEYMEHKHNAVGAKLLLVLYLFCFILAPSSGVGGGWCVFFVLLACSVAAATKDSFVPSLQPSSPCLP